MRKPYIFVALAALALVSTCPLASAQEPTPISGSADQEGGDPAPSAGTQEAERLQPGNPSNAQSTADRAGAENGTETEPAKIAVVTAGDPDDDLQNRGRELDRLFSRTQGLRIPSDSGLRRALRGGTAPDEDDGLGRVRILRRGLGIDDAEDAGGLSALGRVSGAVAVVAIRRRAGTIEATVLDVASARLYEGELELNGADDDAIVRFVLPRAQASALRAAERAAEASARDWRGGAATAQDGAGAGRGSSRSSSDGAENAQDDDDDEDDADDADEPGFFAKWWPYMVGALLLGGALVYAFAVDTTPDAAPPVLRFIPGGN